MLLFAKHKGINHRCIGDVANRWASGNGVALLLRIIKTEHNGKIELVKMELMKLKGFRALQKAVSEKQKAISNERIEH